MRRGARSGSAGPTREHSLVHQPRSGILALGFVGYHPEPVSRREVLLLAVAAGICVAALYLKQPQAFRLPQFYAEEGQVFFADAYNDGWVSLTYTANGYFHLFPRLLANLTLALRVPYAHIPAVFVYTCLPVYFWLWYLIFARL